MFRHTSARLVYEKFHGSIAGDKGHMTLQQACSIFGFQLNEEWNKKEVKKRFNKLALKFHPDHGGTNEQFMALKEAQNIMLTHRHDKGRDRAQAKGEVNFKRTNYDDLTGTIHRQTAGNAEYRTFGLMDFAIFIIFFSAFTFYYLYRAYQTQKNVMKSRWSFSEDKLRQSGMDEKEGRAWHPWMTDSDTRSRMDDIAVLQGSIRQEVVDRKREDAPIVYTPWQPGGPFARHTVSQYPPAKLGGESEREAAVSPPAAHHAA